MEELGNGFSMKYYLVFKKGENFIICINRGEFEGYCIKYNK